MRLHISPATRQAEAPARGRRGASLTARFIKSALRPPRAQLSACLPPYRVQKQAESRQVQAKVSLKANAGQRRQAEGSTGRQRCR